MSSPKEVDIRRQQRYAVLSQVSHYASVHVCLCSVYTRDHVQGRVEMKRRKRERK